MTILSCFMFWNEFDLLKLRLNEHKDVVDYHVLVEANRTFQGKEKPLLFAEQAAAYGDWTNLYSFSITLPEQAREPMDRERAQRDTIARCVAAAQPNDLVLITDADEIISAETITKLRTGELPIPCRLGVRLYHYWLNLRIVGGADFSPDSYWYSPVAVRYSDLAKMSPHDWRWRGQMPKIPDCGWSWSFLGDVASHQAKLAAWSHDAWNVTPYNMTENVVRARKLGVDWDTTRGLRHQWVSIDESYPRYLREHLDEFKQYIAEPPVGVRV